MQSLDQSIHSFLIRVVFPMPALPSSKMYRLDFSPFEPSKIWVEKDKQAMSLTRFFLMFFFKFFCDIICSVKVTLLPDSVPAWFFADLCLPWWLAPCPGICLYFSQSELPLFGSLEHLHNEKTGWGPPPYPGRFDSCELWLLECSPWHSLKKKQDWVPSWSSTNHCIFMRSL